MVPFVTTPREVYIVPLGFFFIPIISKLKVHFKCGCVTWAFEKRRPLGRMKRSYFGGFLVNPGPTNVTLVTILFHCLAAETKIINQKCYCQSLTSRKPNFNNFNYSTFTYNMEEKNMHSTER